MTLPDSPTAAVTLDNGLRVLVAPVPQARSIAVGVVVGAGPGDEPAGKDGLAHLAEHLVFQGTTQRDARQIARVMDLAGGEIGGFVTRDYTCLFAHVVDDHGPYALDLLGDLLLNPTVPERALETERAAVLREIAGHGDDPARRVNDHLKAAAWPNHPLGRPVAGNAATVAGLTRDDVAGYLARRYVPGNALLAVAGRVEPDEFAAAANDAFWRWGGPTPPRTERPPPAFEGGVVVEHRAVSEAYFAVGLPALPYTHPDRYAVHILADAMGGGISSHLHRVLREERGLVYHVGAEYQAYRDAGLLVVEVVAAPEDVARTVGAVLVEWWRAALEPVFGDEEVTLARRHLRGRHLLGRDSVPTRLSRLASQAFYFGAPVSDADVLAGLDSVGPYDVRRVAGRLLPPGLMRPAVAVVGPEVPGVDLRAAVAGTVQELVLGLATS